RERAVVANCERCCKRYHVMWQHAVLRQLLIWNKNFRLRRTADLVALHGIAINSDDGDRGEKVFFVARISFQDDLLADRINSWKMVFDEGMVHNTNQLLRISVG